jgi:hypothetical protein
MGRSNSSLAWSGKGQSAGCTISMLPVTLLARPKSALHALDSGYVVHRGYPDDSRAEPKPLSWPPASTSVAAASAPKTQAMLPRTQRPSSRRDS